MAGNRPSARRKILEAAAKLADDTGPGSLSLEAVAKEAGISKGGLLYHFPSKAALGAQRPSNHPRGRRAVGEALCASFASESASSAS